MSRPAPWSAAVGAQVRMEAALTARRGENLLAMVGIPAGVLLVAGFALTGAGGTGGGPGSSTVADLVHGTLALAIVASGMVNLGIATAYERGYGVLRRLGGSPLGRSGLVAAKVAVVLLIAVAQVAAVLAIASLALGWRPGPDPSIGLLVGTTLLGATAFAGFGLLIAGALRPEAALVVANVLFLLAIPLGGGLRGVLRLPDPLADLVAILPVGALAEAFGAALGSGTDALRPLAILGAWAVAATVAAARTFRWD